MKKNILHIAVHLGGGVGKAILGAAYQNEWFETQIVLLEEPEKVSIVNRAKKQGIKIHICPCMNIVEEWIKESDVVIINWWNHPLMSKFLCEIPQVEMRLAIWVHVNGCSYPYLPFEFLNTFEYIFFTTKYSYQNNLWSKEELEIIKRKSRVIYGSGDFRPEKMVPKENYQNQNSVRVGYIGTLNYSKINKKYVEFCEKAAEYNDNLKFILVGDMDSVLYKDIEKSTVREKFELWNYVEDTKSVYLSLDILGYILNEDNYGTTENVILEAMAYGVPVIAYDGGAERAIIDDQINGFLIHDPNEYAECVKMMAEDDALREQIGRAGRKKVCAEFSFSENMGLFWQRCKRICKNKGKEYNFQMVIGERPLEWFLYFTGRDRFVFEKFLRNKTEGILQELCLCKPIYAGERKSSVRHFANYFPEASEIRQMARILETF